MGSLNQNEFAKCLLTPEIKSVNTSLGDKFNNALVTIKINGIQLCGTLDTGAHVTVLSLNGYKTANLKASGEMIQLKQADGGSVLLANVVPNVRIGVGKCYVKMNLYVADIADSVLLGLDFLLKTRAIINLQQNKLEIPGSSIPITLANVNTKNIKALAYVDNRIVLNSGEERLLKMSCTDHGDSNSPLLFVPSSEWYQLCLPVCLIPNDKDTRFIMVKNMTSERIIIQPGKVLGTLESVNICHARTNQESAIIRQLTKTSKMPDHICDMYQRSIDSLSVTQADMLKRVLIQYADVFSSHPLDLGCYTGLEHVIDTGDAMPVKQRMRRTPAAFQTEEEEHLKKLLDMGVIEPSNSEWSSPPVLIRKKSGAVRYCLDYRSLNKVTVKDSFPLPLIEECFDALEGVQYLSTTDLSSGYYQLLVAERDRHKTAFGTKFGLFQWKRLSMGLCNAPSTFQRAMSQVLSGLNWKICIVYLDDLVVVGKDFMSHLHNLELVFQRLRLHNLKLSPKKCQFMRPDLKFLGWIVGRNGISIPPENTEAIQNRKRPVSTFDVESFLGFVNYHRTHIKQFAELAAPLYALTGVKNRKIKFIWNETHQKAFDDLKQCMTTAPVMKIPNKYDLFVLDVDASNIAIGAELLQVVNNEEYVIAYASFSLQETQRKYCTTRKELLAIVRFTQHFKHYLLGRKFLLRSDHASLTWLMKFKNADGQLARWLEILSQFDMIIEHRPGRLHVNADYLSRPTGGENKCIHAANALNYLPCGGCNYCTKAHTQWAQFFDEIDDVVPLSVKPRICKIGKDTAQDKTSTSNWLCTQDINDIICNQQREPEFIIILSWLEDGTAPSIKELSLSSAESKAYWKNKHLFTLIEGVLYHTRIVDDQTTLLLMIPRVMRDNILESCHGHITTGHLSYRKSLKILYRHFFWWGAARDCEIHVQTCKACNVSKKANRKLRATLGTYHAGYPLERVHLDFLGPFPESNNGNKYILMLVDQFTKWVECYPLPDQTALSTARVFIDNFVSRFGSPCIIHTDQGRQFEGDLFGAMCQILDISKSRTTPHHPASNAQVERYNATLMSLVRAHLIGGSKDWDLNIPLLAGAIRGMVNRHTGFTANMMMLGREVKLPMNHIYGSQCVVPETVNEYIRNLADNMKNIYKHAQDSLRTSLKVQKDDYDRMAFMTHYKSGDLVYRRNLAFRKGECRKTVYPWVGPFLVIEKLSEVTYRVRGKNRTLVLHHDNLKLCQDRDVPEYLKRLRHRLLNKLPMDGHIEGEAITEFWDLVDPEMDNSVPDVPSNANNEISKDNVEQERLPVTPPRVRRRRNILRPRHLADYDCEYKG